MAEDMFLRIVTIFFLIGITRCDHEKALRGVTCDCEYHKGGCVINVAPPEGFKCKCKYHLPLRCSAAAFPCVDNEHCPGNLADYCACKSGGGDCGGYVEPDTACYGNSKPYIIAPATAQCDCRYQNNGCTISKPAPFGWKCICSEVGFQTCSGWAQGCGSNEICLGDDFSYCSCKQGGGNCEGYPENKRSKCLSSRSSHPCNCEEESDWIKGIYTVDSVSYDTSQINYRSSKPIMLAQKVIPNKSDKNLKVAFTVKKNMTFSSSFTYEKGVEIQRSLSFEATFPKIGPSGPPLTEPLTHIYGETKTVELPFKHTSICTGIPYKITKCTAFVQNGIVSVPYTMSVKHNIIPNCVCQSNGTWTGLQVFDPQFLSVPTDECNSNDCRSKTAVEYELVSFSNLDGRELISWEDNPADEL